MHVSMTSSLTNRATRAISTMSPQARVTTGVLLTGASVFTGAVISGNRDSVVSQTVAYAGVLGVLGAIPAFALGRGALAVASRRTAQALESGAIDDAQAAATMLAARGRTMRPARMMAAASGGVAAGVVAGNIAFHAGQESMLRHVLEQQSASSRADKER